MSLARRLPSGWPGALAAALGALLAAPFALYAVALAVDALGGPSEPSRFFAPDRPIATAAVYAHMATGGVLTLLVFLQVPRALRSQFPAFHRWTGRLAVSLALLTALAGLAYIVWRGTIGGPWMSAGFALYGLLLGAAAGCAWSAARARDFERHRAWALRLAVLALGSWVYRVAYGLWYLATDGLWSNEAFTGAFDITMFFAFYLVPLAFLELWQARHRARLRP
ncbi:DUF2306 domain-containing protein [Litorisediminicola beolgyonensis]|uniref:DUF2306 domain-containing protein n=1 Tax=Litorisediminicola beolgyonensis TaxID=1173614 RepID=A0ABW3ZI43_9RHOB